MVSLQKILNSIW